MSDSTFISVDWLRRQLPDPSIVLVDVRPPPYFMQGHLPGAVSLPLFFLVGPGGETLAADQLAARLGALGVRRDSHVVAYDDGASPSAAHLYWVLAYYQHPRVSILDGGITAWLHEGEESETRVEARAPVPYEMGKPDASVLVTTDQLLASLGDPDQIVVDVRTHRSTWATGRPRREMDTFLERLTSTGYRTSNGMSMTSRGINRSRICGLSTSRHP